MNGLTIHQRLLTIDQKLQQWNSENSETGYSVVVDVEYCEYLDPLHKDIPFLLEKR